LIRQAGILYFIPLDEHNKSQCWIMDGQGS